MRNATRLNTTANDNSHIHTMKHKHTFKSIWAILVLVFLAAGSACAQVANPVSPKQVQELANQGDYAGLVKLIDAQEAGWQKTPSIGYFQDMWSIADVLTGGTTAQVYWLGRKAIWKMLLKPTPNEHLAPRQFYLWRHTMFFLGAEAITPYVNNLSPEMFAAVRHDTFLMLSEYARQLHATIIPGYRNKFAGAMNDAAERKRLMQIEIDNEVQSEARAASVSLSDDTVSEQYLIDAYSHDSRDPEELKQLFDILNIRDPEREQVMRATR